MGNCLFLNPNDKNIKTPREIKDTVHEEIMRNNIEAALDPLQPIDIIIEENIPNTLFNNLRKKESEFSIESPYNVKSPKTSQVDFSFIFLCNKIFILKKIDRKEKKKNKIIAYEDGENQKIYEKFNKIPRKIHEKDIYLILKSLRAHSLFFDLSETEL